MNAQENMGARGLEFGFGFLKTQASFDIQFSLIDYDGSHTYARAYLVAGIDDVDAVAFVITGTSTFSTRLTALLQITV